jgi:hypothetical protein
VDDYPSSLARPRRGRVAGMVPSLLAIFAVGVTEPLTCALCWGDDAVLRARVRDELPAALSRVEASAGQWRGSGVVSDHRYPRVADQKKAPSKRGSSEGAVLSKFRTDQPRQVVLQEKLFFALDNTYQKVEVVRSIAKSFDQETGQFVPAKASLAETAHRAACTGPSYSFILHWPAGEAKPVVRSLHQNPASGIQEAIDRDLRLLRAPFSYGLHPLSLTMKEPTFEIKKLSQFQEDNKEFISLEYEYDNAIDSRAAEKAPGQTLPTVGRHSGSIVLSPADSWAIQQLSISPRPGQKVTIDIQYGKHVGGIPLPSRITQYTSRLEQLLVLDVDDIVVGHTAPAEFTLAAYGLPEVDLASPSARHGWNHARLWFGGALFALILAVSLKYLGQRFWTRKKIEAT